MRIVSRYVTVWCKKSEDVTDPHVLVTARIPGEIRFSTS